MAKPNKERNDTLNSLLLRLLLLLWLLLRVGLMLRLVLSCTDVNTYPSQHVRGRALRTLLVRQSALSVRALRVALRIVHVSAVHLLPRSIRARR